MRTTNAVARRKRVRRTLKRARGFYGRRSKCFKNAKESLMRAGRFAFVDRRRRRREFRSLWIVRINAAVREAGMSYSRFMNGLKKAGVTLDRKQLSELAIHDPATFSSLVSTARSAIG